MSKLERYINFTLLALLMLCLVASSYSRILTPMRRNLEPREIPSVDSFLPQSSVVLDYGYGALDPAHVSVLVKAHQDRPILLLEALDPAVVESIVCHHSSVLSSISLTLMSEEMVNAALRAWADNGHTTFNIVSSHFGCNAANERGAWSVSPVESHARTIVLTVSPLPLQEVGKTFDVSLRHGSMGGRWTPGAHFPQHDSDASARLEKREGIDSTRAASYNEDISGTEIFPGNSSALGLASDIIQDLTGASLEIICTECASKFNFSVGIDFSFSAGLTPSVSKARMFASVLEFDQSVILDIKVKKTLEEDFTFDLTKIPVDGFEVPGLFAVGPSIGLSVDFNFTITDEVDFKVGANTSIPAKANGTIDLLKPSNAVALGWGGVSFKTSHVRINGGAPNFTIGAALAPFVEFDLTIGTGNNDTCHKNVFCLARP